MILFSIFMEYLIISAVNARIGFKKDSMLDFQFPPRLEPSYNSHIPVGHLRPLGWQRKPDSAVPTYSHQLSPREFYLQYVRPRRPVVFTAALQDVPAMKTWQSDEHLKKQYGHLAVQVVVKKEFFSKGSQKLTMSKFLYEYHYEDWYLSTIVPREMMHEMRLPRMLKCGMRNFLEKSEVWMSSGGTSSLLHAHADHDLHCLLSGRKDFILIERQHRGRFAWVEGVYPGAGHSTLDMEMLNMFEHRDIADTPWQYYTLRPGDCIYVPAQMPHQVRSYGRSISSTMHFIPTPDYDFTDCAHTDLGRPVPLDTVYFLWVYEAGGRRLASRELDAESMRGHLLLLMRDLPVLPAALFSAFYTSATAACDAPDDVTQVWARMDTANKGRLTRAEVKLMDRSVLKSVAKSFNLANKVITNHEEL